MKDAFYTGVISPNYNLAPNFCVGIIFAVSLMLFPQSYCLLVKFMFGRTACTNYDHRACNPT